MRLIPWTTFCSISALTLVLAAADAPQLDPAKIAAEYQKKILEKYDTNKDGKLSDAEKLRAQEELRRGGGLLGSGIVPGGFPGAEELLKKFDKNGDGKLSDAEKGAAQTALQKMRQGGGPVSGGLGGGGGGFGGGGFGGGFGEAGGDQAVPADAADEKPGKKVNPLIKLYDKDGDGKLNAEEKAALQADRAKKKGKKAKAE